MKYTSLLNGPVRLARHVRLWLIALLLPLSVAMADPPIAPPGAPLDRLAPSLSASAALAAMQQGLFTTSDYVDMLIARIEVHPEINAFIHLDVAGARGAARQADELRAAGTLLGALHGLPIVVKDSINVAGMPTTAGTPALQGYLPESSAPVVQALVDAGAIVLGKTNLHELSVGFTTNNYWTGPTRNPYDFDRIPGGSGGGNSAALAAGLAPLALGEDTIGSTRVPAALTGTTGFRPTTGRYSMAGVVPVTASLDVLGPLARDVRDLALADAVITGEPIAELQPVALSELRLGVPAAHFRDQLDPPVAWAFHRALERLAGAGATLVPGDLPGPGMLSAQAWQVIAFYEAPFALAEFLAASGTGVTLDDLVAGVASPDVAALFALAASGIVTEQDYLQVTGALVPFLRALYLDYLDGHELDAVIYPTTILPAVLIGQDEWVEVDGEPRPLLEAYSHNAHYTPVIGAPTVTLPIGQRERGLPAGGMDVAGRHGDDRRVLAIAHAIEQELPRIRAPVHIRPIPLP